MRHRCTRWTSRLATAALPGLLLAAPPAYTQQPAPVDLQARRIAVPDSVNVRGPLMSPDGRWILFMAIRPSGFSNVWVMPSGGGTPIPLTTGNHRDVSPRWFPSRHKIIFISDRTSRTAEKTQAVLVLPFDPSSGRAAGPARQVTVDRVRKNLPGHQVSPDGRWIFYMEEGTNRIKVVPSTGGAARTVAQTDKSGVNIAWSADGRHIFFMTTAPGETRVMRVPTTGGTPQEVFRTNQQFGLLTPGAKSMLVWDDDEPGSRTRSFRLINFQGRVLARYRIDRKINTAAMGLTPDGRRLLGYQNGTTASLRVVPISGGRHKALTSPTDSYDWPLGWTPDGAALVGYRGVNGRYSLVAAPVTGGTPRLIPLPDGADLRRSTVFGTHATYNMPLPGTKRHRLMAIDLTTGRSTEISRQALSDRGPVWGAGGRYNVTGGEVLYWEQNGNQMELRASRLGGPARVVRRFPASIANRPWFGVAVHGNQIAFCELTRDSAAALMIADGPSAPARRIAMLSPEQRTCGVNVSWSHDGRWIATHHRWGDGKIHVYDASRNSASGTPRVLDAGIPNWWEAAWLPDDSGFTIQGESQNPAQSHILFVSLRGDAPVNLTQGDPAPKYGHVLSPDGRLVAYPAQVQRGSSIVILDLPSTGTNGKRTPQASGRRR